jgi:catalase
MAADVKKYNTRDDDNFSQVTNFWLNVLSREERERLVFNIASHLKDAQGFIQERAVR